ncbi:MAG: acyl-ACP thioesterase [Ruminococcus sp.]|nr:acyl-ACP thioesterase [Ruminococcus sp.]
MIYEMQRTVRCSQIGEDGAMRSSALVDFMQDCSLGHLDNEPVMTPYFRETGCIMFLISRQLDIVRKPQLDEKVTVKTWCYELNRLYGFRNTVIYGENGEILVKSIAGGCFIDSASMRTMKVPQEVIDRVKLEPKLEDIQYLPRKITLPDCEPQTFENVHINRCFIDMNKHVNNARYLDITDEFLPDGAKVKRIRCEYKLPVRRDSIVIPKVYTQGNILTVDLTTPQGKCCTAVEYTLDT